MGKKHEFRTSYEQKCWYKLFFIAFLVMIFTMPGCETIEEYGGEPVEPISEEPIPEEPLVSYLEEIEEQGILDDLEQIEVDVSSLTNEIESLFQKPIKEQSIEDIIVLRAQLPTLIDQHTDLKKKVSILDTGSKKVENANNHLIEAIKYQKNAINMFNTMFDYSIELITIMEDPGCPDAKDALSRIITWVEKDEIKINEYISASHDNIEAWISIMEKGDDTLIENDLEEKDAEDKSVAEAIKEADTTPQCFVVDIENLKLRRRPLIDAKINDILEKGTHLLLLNKVSRSEGEEWLHVITQNGYRGWVQGDYVIKKSNLSVLDEIGENRKKVLQSMKEGNIYDDPLLMHLGLSKEELIAKHGLPDSVYWIGGPGGDGFVYEDKSVAFVFAGDEGVINNFVLSSGASILGVTIGKMCFNDIEMKLGKPNYRGATEKYEDLYLLNYKVGEHYQSQGEIEMFFYSDGDDIPPDHVKVQWKKYWW